MRASEPHRPIVTSVNDLVRMRPLPHGTGTELW